MSEDSFGLWAALAIHDTSSVVGAASQSGTHALEVATAAKLARALWIRTSAPSTGDKPKRPWFIAGFLVVAALVTYVPALRALGVRPMLTGIVLWALLASGTLGAILLGWIR